MLGSSEYVSPSWGGGGPHEADSFTMIMDKPLFPYQFKVEKEGGKVSAKSGTPLSL